MKIIRVISTTTDFKIDIHPDSTILPQGRPLFMPEWGDDWRVHLHPAIKIGRLGKNISKKFASRYYDGASVACRVILSNPDELEGMLSAMDSSLFHGEWQPASWAETGHELKFNDTTVSLPPISQTIDEVIAYVSEYMTLKIGDIILLPPIGNPATLCESTIITVTDDTTTMIKTKVV